MAKSKTQAELAERFAKGDQEGTVTFLSIVGDVIYNTEVPKYGDDGRSYMPIAIRLSEKVALVNNRHKGSQWSDHKNKVVTALTATGYQILDLGISPVKTPAELPAPDSDGLKSVTLELEATVESLKKNIASPDTNQADISDCKNRLETAERKQRALAQFLSGHKQEQGKVTLDILTELPEILEKAVKEKHVDENQLQEILAARNQVKGLIEEVDKYLALILSLPTGAQPQQQPAPEKGAV
ncbi:MAG: hypothetical protein O8C56_01185 [Candidatus Methanoperedens sp.]|nr:hypothetical protein [Candidatus Methanoperedens sp.]